MQTLAELANDSGDHATATGMAMGLFLGLLGLLVVLILVLALLGAAHRRATRRTRAAERTPHDDAWAIAGARAEAWDAPRRSANGRGEDHSSDDRSEPDNDDPGENRADDPDRT